MIPKGHQLQTELSNYLKKYRPQGSLTLPIFYIPELFIVCDRSHSKAMVLSYLLDIVGTRSDEFICKSQVQLANEFGYSRITIIRIFNWLKDQDILETKIKKAHGIPITHFRFKKKELYAFCKKKLQENAHNSNMCSKE